MKSRRQLLALATSTTLAGSLLMSAQLSAAQQLEGAMEQPLFTITTTLMKHDEGKCGGEGKCGEGKCGEGKCGEGKCGEGKCGEGK